MSELFFVLKMFGITIGLIVLMQMKVGSMSLEERSYILLKSSAVTYQLQKVADGGVQLYNKVEQKITKFYDDNFATRSSRRNASDKVKDLKWNLRRESARSTGSRDSSWGEPSRASLGPIGDESPRLDDPGDD